MAKFLTTTAISYQLEELIKTTHSTLILISPYLQFNSRIKEIISELKDRALDITLIYRENNLSEEDNAWLSQINCVKTKVCGNLHAKCYLNENAAIICSMNLYEYSQVNNNEMGIYVTKQETPQLYNEILEEAVRLSKISKDAYIPRTYIWEAHEPEQKDISRLKSGITSSGYCIRTGIEIPFNLEKPMCYEAFKKWSHFADPSYPEKYCHFSGERTNGENSMKNPILKKNWKKAKEVHRF